MLTKDQLNAFALEISTFGNIPISSKNCGIGCIYCKVHSDPVLKRYPTIPDITLKDLYQGFNFVDNTSRYLRLGAGVLVAAHTDPYLHPLIYDFIRHTADFFPQKMITTVTTGSYIQESKLDFLQSISNFGIDLSLITMQEFRETIVPKSTRNRLNHILKYAPLNKVTLMFTGDLDVLKRDLDLLYSLDIEKKAHEILVRRIEYTSYSQSVLNSTALKSIRMYEDCVQYLKENHPSVIYTVPILNDVFRGGNNEYFTQADERIQVQVKRSLTEANRFFEIICSESSFGYFFNKLQKYHNVRVNLIKNKLYGGSVTVAGLLNHCDIISQFKPQNNKCVIVLPSEMYNREQKDIMGNHIKELEVKYNSEIWVI